MFAHKSSEPPIGKCVEIHTESNPPALVQTIQFADAATYPFAEVIFNLYRERMMNAVSVGFMPLEMPNRITDLENNTTGYEFTSQELLELSAVPIPANADCLARAVQKGFGDADLARVFAPVMTEAEVYKELAEINHEIARVAVALAKATLLKANEVRALLMKARGVETAGELTYEELLAIVKSPKASALELGDEEIEAGGDDITTLDQLADAVGTPDEEPSLEEVFSDSRSLRTGKFHFALRSELQ